MYAGKSSGSKVEPKSLLLGIQGLVQVVIQQHIGAGNLYIVRPVPVEFFIGRADEIKNFVSSIKKSIALSTVERLYVSGERGIGKSSICKFARLVAERDLNILGIHVYLGGVTTLEEMVHRIFDQLLRENIDKPWYEKIKRFLGNHIKQVDIFGLSVGLWPSGCILFSFF